MKPRWSDSVSSGKTGQIQRQVEQSLDPSWSEWLDGMTISQEAKDVTSLSGPIRDQAALFGLLVKLRDRGLNLISVNRVETLDKGSKLAHERN